MQVHLTKFSRDDKGEMKDIKHTTEVFQPKNVIFGPLIPHKNGGGRIDIFYGDTETPLRFETPPMFNQWGASVFGVKVSFDLDFKEAIYSQEICDFLKTISAFDQIVLSGMLKNRHIWLPTIKKHKKKNEQLHEHLRFSTRPRTDKSGAEYPPRLTVKINNTPGEKKSLMFPKLLPGQKPSDPVTPLKMGPAYAKLSIPEKTWMKCVVEADAIYIADNMLTVRWQLVQGRIVDAPEIDTSQNIHDSIFKSAELRAAYAPLFVEEAVPVPQVCILEQL